MCGEINYTSNWISVRRCHIVLRNNNKKKRWGNRTKRKKKEI
jgi:hypothetical protein